MKKHGFLFLGLIGTLMVAMVAVFAFQGVACAGETPRHGGKVTYPAPSFVSTMNPLLGGQAKDGYWRGPIFHGLLGRTESMAVAPYAASSWEWKGPLTLHLRLRSWSEDC